MKTVVVTGVSTGIGQGTARVLAKNGFHVFGSVRNARDAQPLVDELGKNFSTLVFDVTDEAAVRQGAAQVAAQLGGECLAGLVNNAGIAAPAPLMHQPIAEFRRQLEVNLVSPLIVTQAFLPLLGTDKARTGARGRIVNISSVGGKIGAPFIGAYVASKHGLEGLSESLRRELMLYGIDVIIVGPGSVKTPIWDKAERLDMSQYDNTDYRAILPKVRAYFLKEGRAGFAPERIGATVLQALAAPNPGVRYAVVPKRFLNWTLPNLLPRRMLDKAIAGQLGMTKP